MPFKPRLQQKNWGTESHCQDCPHGWWRYFYTSNGTCSVMPGFEKKNIQNLSQGFSDEMSSEAAGITTTLHKGYFCPTACAFQSVKGVIKLRPPVLPPG
ncbi:antirestriction protein [Erwinia sp. MMLR14_017]|uniref:antirestriction protein n=1 Tax=Erwinia sp. MMLR14_017 TaxID=3093842 RepID=UPI0039A13400